MNIVGVGVCDTALHASTGHSCQFPEEHGNQASCLTRVDVSSLIVDSWNKGWAGNKGKKFFLFQSSVIELGDIY